MIDKFSKMATDAIKSGSEIALINKDRIVELAKSGVDIIWDNNKETVTEDNDIQEIPKHNLKQRTINLIQEALNNISPLKIDVNGSIDEKSIVITEESLNTYLNSQIIDIPELESINIQVSEDNILLISGEIKKSLFEVSFSQKLKLEKFEMSHYQGIVEFSLINEPDIRAKSFISNILLFFTRSVLKSVVNKNILEVMNENNIQFKEDKFYIDLKNGPAKQIYEVDINNVLGRNIPLIGTKKIIDLIGIKELTTKNQMVIVGLGF